MKKFPGAKNGASFARRMVTKPRNAFLKKTGKVDERGRVLSMFSSERTSKKSTKLFELVYKV